ncbi:MAG: nitroreductase family protein [Bacteroidota bacterium]|nr:nitroreductase family protein [Bacteroidota bacterium]
MDNLLDLLRNRRSTRIFKETQISPELVESLMKAALMSPSSKNSRPWQFVLVDDPDKLKQLAACKKSGSKLIGGTALSVVVIADPAVSDAWIEDASIASTLLQLEAEDLGLGSCWVQVRQRQTPDGGDAEAYVRQLLDIPETYSVLNIIGIGIKDEFHKPHDDAKLLWEKVHLNQFGKTE